MNASSCCCGTGAVQLRLNAISTFFGSQPRNAQVPPNGWMTATRQPVARQRWAATDAAVPCQSGRDGRSEAWRLWQPLQWKRCDQKISSQHHLSLMYHSPPRHAPVARQFDFCHRVPRQLMLVGHRQHHSEARLAAHHPCVSLWNARKRHCPIGSYRSGCSDRPRRVAPSSRAAAAHICQAGSRTAVP